MDGCHKLIKFGMVIHACIDGFSRYVLYLACEYNNRACTVLKLFKGGCKEVSIIPRRVRSDKGGENMGVCRFMLNQRGVNSNCFIASRSTSNQKVERLHRDSTDKLLFSDMCVFVCQFH